MRLELNLPRKVLKKIPKFVEKFYLQAVCDVFVNDVFSRPKGGNGDDYPDEEAETDFDGDAHEFAQARSKP